MSRRLTVIAVTALLAACTRHAEQRSTYANAPVILISIDTLRADHLPAYGYSGVSTPAIDAFAKQSTIFDAAWSHCPMTLPSHVSMLTGLLPTTHGVRNNLGFRYDSKRFPSLPQELQQSGYATGASVSAYVLRGETGLRDAFQWYDDAVDPSPGARFSEYQRSGDVTVARAEQWLDGVANKPFFLFVHLYEPHVPYDPPEPFRSRYASKYDGEIATADAIVGRFLDDLKRRGIYDRAIIVLTSDHGEGLGDHGEQQHSILLYTETLRVPLMIKLPHGNSSTHVRENVATDDIAPTLRALLRLPTRTADGVDLFAKLPASRDIYSETIYPYVQLGWSDLRSAVSGSLHYIDSPRPELYDVAADPHERADAITAHRRDAARLRTFVGGFPPPTAGSAVDAETAAKLASLGYVGSAQARPDPRTLPNPVEQIGTIEEISAAFALAAQQRYGEALPRLRSLVSTNPRLADVWVKLGDVEVEMGATNEAIDAYRHALAAGGVFSSETLVTLGNVCLDAGRIAEAENAARAAMSGSPDKAKALEVRIALTKHDTASAMQLAQKLTSRPSATPSDWLLLARAQRAAGDLRGAMQTIDSAESRAAAAKEKGVYGAEDLRGEVLITMQRPAEGAAAYEKEIAAFPRNRATYSKLAVLRFAMGDRAACDATLERLVKANPTPAAYELAARTLDAVEDVRGAQRWRARKPR